MENLEIERKFLLKNLPIFAEDKVVKLHIHQVYVDVDGESTRFRATKTDNNKMVYHKCIKREISHGVFSEVESNIEKSEFYDMCELSHTYISKNRYVYEDNGLKWEVDKYHNIHLITLEVELNDIKQEIIIPMIIQDEIITEVTGIKAFSNFMLSIKG